MTTQDALRTEPADDPDGLYAVLVDAHRDLTAAESHALNTRLILVLANHVGDRAVVERAVAIAREAVARSPTATGSFPSR
jgi:hypothetical protein